jgi:hypothetical protein
MIIGDIHVLKPVVLKEGRMKQSCIIIWQFALLVSLCSTALGAQGATTHVEMTDTEIKAKTFEKFQGINFGLGVGVVGAPSDRLAQNGAQVVNGIVRVEDQSNTTASVLLESHYFFADKERPRFGHGPFVALRSGGSSNQIIDSIGLGYMLGWRYDDKSNSSWNIGAGLSINPSARVLGDGITKNAPLPLGETEVRTQTQTLLGFMILVSFSWNTFEPTFTKPSSSP